MFNKWSLILLVFLGLLAAPLRGQTSQTGRVSVGFLANRPTVCASGDMFVATDNAIVYVCGPSADVWASMGTGTPGGANTQVQFNNSGSFAGSPAFTWSNTTGLFVNLTATTPQSAISGELTETNATDAGAALNAYTAIPGVTSSNGSWQGWGMYSELDLGPNTNITGDTNPDAGGPSGLFQSTDLGGASHSDIVPGISSQILIGGLYTADTGLSSSNTVANFWSVPEFGSGPASGGPNTVPAWHQFNATAPEMHNGTNLLVSLFTGFHCGNLVNSATTTAACLSIDNQGSGGYAIKTGTGKVSFGDAVIGAGIVDGQTAVTVTTGTSATLGGTYSKTLVFNEEATAGAAVTYTLPVAVAGKVYCAINSNNGSAPDTGVLTLQTSGTGQFIIFTDGTLTASGGYVSTNGAAADQICVEGVDSTHWFLQVVSGGANKH